MFTSFDDWSADPNGGGAFAAGKPRAGRQADESWDEGPDYRAGWMQALAKDPDLVTIRPVPNKDGSLSALTYKDGSTKTLGTDEGGKFLYYFSPDLKQVRELKEDEDTFVYNDGTTVNGDAARNQGNSNFFSSGNWAIPVAIVAAAALTYGAASGAFVAGAAGAETAAAGAGTTGMMTAAAPYAATAAESAWAVAPEVAAAAGAAPVAGTAAGVPIGSIAGGAGLMGGATAAGTAGTVAGYTAPANSAAITAGESAFAVTPEAAAAAGVSPVAGTAAGVPIGSIAGNAGTGGLSLFDAAKYANTAYGAAKALSGGGNSGGGGGASGGLMSSGGGGGTSDNQLRPPPIPVPQYAQQQQQPIMNQAAKAKTWQEYMAETQRNQRGYYGGYIA